MLTGTEEPASGVVNPKIISNSDQITFVNNIIRHLTKIGTFYKSLLFNTPFIDNYELGISGVFGDTLAMKKN